jgi:hypothetical protein
MTRRNDGSRSFAGTRESVEAGLRLIALGFLAHLTIPAVVAGQAPRWEVDISGSRIEFDTATALNAPSLATLAEWQRPALFGRVRASLTGFEGAGWSMQGRGDLAGWLSPLGVSNPLRFELAGALGGSRHSSGFDTFLTRGDVRLHVRGRSFGLWGGAGLATARSSFDSASVRGFVPQAGVWAQDGSVRATLTYLHTRLSGETYPEANVSVAISRGVLDLTLYGGYRRSPVGGEEVDETWGGVATALWIRPRLALTLSGGEYAADLLQSLPGGQFLSVGIRLTPRRSRPVPVTAAAPIVYSPEAARTGSIGFRVEGATQVEIAADWNGWQLTPLVRDGSSRWIVPVRLEPGVYRFNLLVDGERWVVPDEVAQIDDGFGDSVGLLIISERD